MSGPPINLVASGTNIGGSNNYTLDQPIVLAFDRFLDPSTVTRQSFLLEDSGGAGVADVTIRYDPVTLTVSLSPMSGEPWLNSGAQYRVVVNVPSFEGGSTFGLKAIDGATLSAPATILFKAGEPASPPAASPPTINFCNDILGQIFINSCSYGTCHVAAQPSMPMVDAGHPPLGLDLSSAAGVRATAIGQVADESNTGPNSTSASQIPGAPFGIDMNVISPSEPGYSWLLYKALLAAPAPASSEPVGGTTGVDSYGQNLTYPVSAAELARLQNYILGQPMPYPSFSDGAPTPSDLTMGDLERLSLWIQQGAITPASCP